MAAMMPALGEVFANPSSVHKPGQDARALLDRAREQCGAALECDPREIVFTSGGTEADALAVRGLGRRKVVATAVEHPALLGADLCSAMAANNETGIVFPLARIGELCRKHGVPLHADAVQAVGKMPLRIRELPIDLLSCSAHKIGGPKGAGLLWVRRGLQLAPVQVGGHQERGRRAGTENVAAIVGLGEALSRAAASLSTEAPRLAALRDRLEAAARQIPGS